jgi:hypothetical protein
MPYVAAEQNSAAYERLASNVYANKSAGISAAPPGMQCGICRADAQNSARDEETTRRKLAEI